MDKNLLEFDEIEGKLIWLEANQWEAISHEFLEMYRGTIDCSVRIRGTIDENKDKEQIGYIYIHHGFHQKTGRKVIELRGKIFENSSIIDGCEATGIIF